MTRPAGPEYAFANSPVQMNPLTAFLDPLTRADLDHIGVRPGWRCLSVGAGSGTVAHMLVERTGPDGHVIAVDRDTSLIAPRPGLTVITHDLRDLALPVDGPFDLIEARTQHLPDREGLLDVLIDRLTPGGWLLLGEFVHPRPWVIASATPDGGERVNRAIGVIVGALENAGVDMNWGGPALHRFLIEAGLRVHTRWHAETWTVQTPALGLLADYACQKRDDLLGHGFTGRDLDHLTDILTNDEELIVRSFEIAITRAQQPPTDPPGTTTDAAASQSPTGGR